MVKIDRSRDDLKKLDDIGENALKSEKLMDLIVNGATLMSVNKDTLRGIIRVIISDYYNAINEQYTLEQALNIACEYAASMTKDTVCGLEPNSEFCTRPIPCAECMQNHFMAEAKEDNNATD